MIICPKCGKESPDAASFCMECGAKLSKPETVEVLGQNGSYRPRLNVLAIVGLALSFLGLPGLIVSSIAIKNADYEHYRVPLRPLAITGIALGIFFMVFYICWAVGWSLIFTKIFSEISSRIQ